MPKCKCKDPSKPCWTECDEDPKACWTTECEDQLEAQKTACENGAPVCGCKWADYYWNRGGEYMSGYCAWKPILTQQPGCDETNLPICPFPELTRLSDETCNSLFPNPPEGGWNCTGAEREQNECGWACFNTDQTLAECRPPSGPLSNSYFQHWQGDVNSSFLNDQCTIAVERSSVYGCAFS